MNKTPKIYILGGMGPESSAYFYRMFIKLSERHFGAKNNEDFPEILLHSIPVPDFISDDKRRQKALKMLKKRAVYIDSFGASSACIACNTAHILINDLQDATEAPFVSMINEVVDRVREEKRKKIGLLATPSTIKYALYQDALHQYGIEIVIPNKEQLIILEKIIRNVLKGKITKDGREKIVAVANALKRQGAEAIVLGCTELPVIFPSKYALPIYNSVEILAMALLGDYYGKMQVLDNKC